LEQKILPQRQWVVTKRTHQRVRIGAPGTRWPGFKIWHRTPLAV
jgi:hypothetical protein